MAKKDFHNEMNKVMKQLKANFKRFGKDASIFAKKGEKEIVKASKIGRVQLDIISLNIQKEKLYYEIGKKVAALRTGGEKAAIAVKPYLQKLRKIETNIRSKKREISGIKKVESNK
ncbi:MAG: hypothetical protein HQ579_00195 [Candidatus Omnitrophica bacterium]|nr:hypothetical protein [Candidatus Omnitrophota bacterium]